MDSLQVSGAPHPSSKSSSRSASPSPLLPPSPCPTVLAISPISGAPKPFPRAPHHQHAAARSPRTGDISSLGVMHSVGGSTPGGSSGGGSASRGSAPPRPRDHAAAVLYSTPTGTSTGSGRGSTVGHQGGSSEAISGTEDETDCQLTPVASGVNANNGGGSSSELLGAGGGGGGGADEEVSSTPDLQRARHALERMQEKMGRTKDLIREEQTSRDENVNEYLKLAAGADKQQLTRIKAVFEKKNQKSAQTISGLQRKLESYSRKAKDLEELVAVASSRSSDSSGSHHRQPREVLRDMGQGLKNVGGNIRDGITGFSGTVMSKPREFAHLIKNKFGSADNINSLGKSSFYTGIEESGGSEEEQVGSSHQQSGSGSSSQQTRIHHGSATLPAHASSSHPKFPQHHGSEEAASECSSTSESLPNHSGSGGHGVHHGGGAHHPGGVVPSHQQHQKTGHHVTSPRHVHQLSDASMSSLDFENIYKEFVELREDLHSLRTDFDALKTNVMQDQQFLSQALIDEKFRTERLEEMLNDLTELHQIEVENLKTQLADTEEKVQYQSEERLRDIHEMLEACQTKVSKMEHQQHQHQQYVTLEGIHNSNARALVVKLINVVLTVLQVVLLLVATTAGIVMPFLKTRLRVLTTVVLVMGIVFIFRQWPEVLDVGSHLMRHIKDALAVK